ncbi:hypothetical protein HZB60_04200 [candidate division KSB1 bacterium]|nr:hypothetical protein [candidate division KSB1 bacterium]
MTAIHFPVDCGCKNVPLALSAKYAGLPFNPYYTLVAKQQPDYDAKWGGDIMLASAAKNVNGAISYQTAHANKDGLIASSITTFSGAFPPLLSTNSGPLSAFIGVNKRLNRQNLAALSAQSSGGNFIVSWSGLSGVNLYVSQSPLPSPTGSPTYTNGSSSFNHPINASVKDYYFALATGVFNQATGLWENEQWCSDIAAVVLNDGWYYAAIPTGVGVAVTANGEITTTASGPWWGGFLKYYGASPDDIKTNYKIYATGDDSATDTFHWFALAHRYVGRNNSATPISYQSWPAGSDKKYVFGPHGKLYKFTGVGFRSLSYYGNDGAVSQGWKIITTDIGGVLYGDPVSVGNHVYAVVKKGVVTSNNNTGAGTDHTVNIVARRQDYVLKILDCSTLALSEVFLEQDQEISQQTMDLTRQDIQAVWHATGNPPVAADWITWYGLDHIRTTISNYHRQVFTFSLTAVKRTSARLPDEVFTVCLSCEKETLDITTTQIIETAFSIWYGWGNGVTDPWYGAPIRVDTTTFTNSNPDSVWVMSPTIEKLDLTTLVRTVLMQPAGIVPSLSGGDTNCLLYLQDPDGTVRYLAAPV